MIEKDRYIELPWEVSKLLEVLNSRGYKSYIVGGSVRDLLRGVEPEDWDIATSALPGETTMLFSNREVLESYFGAELMGDSLEEMAIRVKPTGIDQGTVSVIIGENSYEVTTFRIEGPYIDHRHPLSVTFIDNVVQDLARRDFTINAIAYSPTGGMIETFSGSRDIKEKIIRTIGDPEVRFDEDALRIMRAIRFAAVLGFRIADETRKAIHKQKHLLGYISQERIREEFEKLIVGENVGAAIKNYTDIFDIFSPEVDWANAGEELIIMSPQDVCSIDTDLAVRVAFVLNAGGINDPEKAENIMRKMTFSKKVMRDVISKMES